MDRSGNDKKSINSKLPHLIGKGPDKIYVDSALVGNSSILSQTELIELSQGNIEDIANIIWDNYVTTAEIGAFKKTTSRFILYFIEYWLGNNNLKDIIANDKKGTTPELEHIWPLSKENADIYGIAKPTFVNRLENVCLLEKSINSSVGDSYLVEKSKGKLQPASKGYGKSKFKMPNMFYKEEKEPRYCEMADDVGYYSKDMAKARMKDIKEQVIGNFTKDMKLIFKNVSTKPDKNCNQN